MLEEQLTRNVNVRIQINGIALDKQLVLFYFVLGYISLSTADRNIYDAVHQTGDFATVGFLRYRL